MSTPIPGLSTGLFSLSAPKTPEPTSANMTNMHEMRLPSPPRPRLRLKRRAVSHLSAPTQNFLASVAAAEGERSPADMPIPSIELEPSDAIDATDATDTTDATDDSDLRQLRNLLEHDGGFLSVRGRSRFSPPKTPAPDALPSLSPSRYPDWSIDSALSSSVESSPDRECGSSRPSTARSTQTSTSSLFSRFSQLSDDDCEEKEKETVSVVASAAAPRPRRKAPWTRAMTSHLWATYILYLQDPKVTPFRVGKSCVPPHGVCMRVAREAKRSWKGARAVASRRAAGAPLPSRPVQTRGSGSGSSTPTAAPMTAFMEWPHTNAATRAHLRELCRQKASTPGGARGLQYMSRMEGPKAVQTVQTVQTVQPQPQPSEPAQTAQAPLPPPRRHHPSASMPCLAAMMAPMTPASSFATRDMTVSLAVSTSDAMQPQGPLARLTRSGSDFTGFSSSAAAAFSFAGKLTSAIEAEEPSVSERRRLGSPFTARSYGPSSSSSLAAVLGLAAAAPVAAPVAAAPVTTAVAAPGSAPAPAAPLAPVSSSSSSAPTSISRQAHARRSLQSPVRISRSGMHHRRRSQQLNLGREARKRPSLDSNLFRAPSWDWDDDVSEAASAAAAEAAASLSAASAALSTSISAPELTKTAQPLTAGRLDQPLPPLPLLSSLPALQPPARLGSPFSVPLPSSFSFPNRYSQPAEELDAAAVGRPFATVQQRVETCATTKPVPARANLASRMAYLDQRLRELNRSSEGHGHGLGHGHSHSHSHHYNYHRRRRSESPM